MPLRPLACRSIFQSILRGSSRTSPLVSMAKISRSWSYLMGLPLRMSYLGSSTLHSPIFLSLCSVINTASFPTLYVAATTMGTQQTLSLRGAANAQASTGVGTLLLQDIEFSVESTIAGLQG